MYIIDYDKLRTFCPVREKIRPGAEKTHAGEMLSEFFGDCREGMTCALYSKKANCCAFVREASDGGWGPRKWYVWRAYLSGGGMALFEPSGPCEDAAEAGDEAVEMLEFALEFPEYTESAAYFDNDTNTSYILMDFDRIISESWGPSFGTLA